MSGYRLRHGLASRKDMKAGTDVKTRCDAQARCAVRTHDIRRIVIVPC